MEWSIVVKYGTSVQECGVKNQYFLHLGYNQHMSKSGLCLVQDVEVVEVCCCL